MIINPHISLHQLVLSLSEGLDYVSPSVADHQLRLDYMSTEIARNMGYRGDKLRNVFHAAALHDIGFIKAENRIRAVEHNVLEGLAWHAEVGAILLKDNDFFQKRPQLLNIITYRGTTAIKMKYTNNQYLWRATSLRFQIRLTD